nr:PREDICTED: odorant receptor 22c-like [Linepithema humile]
MVSVCDWSADVKVGSHPIFMLIFRSVSSGERAAVTHKALSGTFAQFVRSVDEANFAMIPISTVSRPVEIGLRLTGIWPNSCIFFRLIWSAVMGTGLIFQYHYLLTHFSTKELPNLIDGLSTTLPYSLLFFKLIVLWVNNRYAFLSFLHCRIFISILTAMSEDWYEYSSMQAMINKGIIAHRCSKLIIGVYSTAVLLYSTASVSFRRQAGDDCRELLIKMELPFVFCESPIYEIVICVQFVHLMAVASSIGMLDALIVTLMLHIGGQIDIMHQQLEKICPTDNERDLSTAIMKSLINKHQKIISFSENIESLFSHIALMQFFSNTLIICCIGFLIVTSLGTDEGIRMLVKTVFFYIAITLEAFIFCFAGEYLSNKSKMVGDAAYESLWYTFKPRDCRTLLLVIMRSQKRLTISAGKFMDLSLEGFTTILHTSGQIDILCDALEEISPEKNDHRLAVAITKELIGKHQKIIIFSNKIEKIFCYIALIQFMSSTLVTCCLGFMIVTSIGTMEDSDSVDSSALMKAIVFYMAVTVEAFIFCFSGEYLSAKSKMIGDAAYKSIWYNLNPNESKLILLIMLRSQRRLTITAGKIMDLSLEAFTSIIKASVSYVSVLHAMY